MLSLMVQYQLMAQCLQLMTYSSYTAQRNDKISINVTDDPASSSTQSRILNLNSETYTILLNI